MSEPVASPTTRRALDREILALALPAFATLVSEPLLLMADSAFIGHLGTSQLAGFGIASNVLGILIGLCIFLAYGTTGTVARRLGAGDRAAALAGGFNGLVLAVGLGALLCLGLQLVLPQVIGAYGVTPDVARAASSYLRIAAFGLPSILLLLASTGVLRGLQDTRTPLYVAVATNVVNIGLNFTLVYGLRLGIIGSALGTLAAQSAAALFLASVVVRRARSAGAHLRFHPAGVLSAARSGVWLVARTATLQVAITLTTVVAATGGAVALGAHQVINSLWSLLAFALDAIAIAGQAIVGRYLGAGEVTVGRAITRRMVGWGLVCGAVFGLVVAATAPLYVGVFTADADVQRLVRTIMWVTAVITPVSGIVFVLDGVLIGAGDGRYLALAGLIALLAYAPLALTVDVLHAGLVWLWAAYGAFMIARMLTLLLRARGRRWMRVGAEV
ncbi:MATE family efflux transporter [Microlunatus panaciterrae]|uniref:MATE family efflux protein n=1 Tax=Microlunatus panaciterrae TaxID=400768 RepID=A0ABS2RM60_9ACTN|nr:putative MATE family efflux protein [Microlunatus panaciterrae]